MKSCYHCRGEIGVAERVGRSELCPRCGRDLHCCYNCTFFDPASYNQCREPNAERVLDKDRANFCEYFTFCESAGSETIKRPDPKAGWAELFKKTK